MRADAVVHPLQRIVSVHLINHFVVAAAAQHGYSDDIRIQTRCILKYLFARYLNGGYLEGQHSFYSIFPGRVCVSFPIESNPWPVNRPGVA